MDRKLWLLALGLGILGGAACAETPAVPTPASGGSASVLEARSGGKPRPVDVTATVEFRCPGPQCTGTDRIIGDGLGAYVGRIWGSTGEFNLQIDDPARSLTIDYRAQLDATRARRWFDTITVTGANGVLLQNNTVYPGTDTETPGGLRDIPVGATWPSRMKLGYSNTSPTGVPLVWGDRFNPSGFPGSTHVSITRLSETEWTVEATTAEIAYVRSTADRRSGGEVFEGYYQLPFRMKIVAVQ